MKRDFKGPNTLKLLLMLTVNVKLFAVMMLLKVDLIF